MLVAGIWSEEAGTLAPFYRQMATLRWSKERAYICYTAIAVLHRSRLNAVKLAGCRLSEDLSSENEAEKLV